MREATCVIVGPNLSGKSSLVSKYCLDEYPSKKVGQDIIEPINKALEEPNGEDIVSLSIVDTRSSIYETLSVDTIPHPHCVVLCLDLSQPIQIHDINDTWLPRIKSLWPKAPILGVGTKLDERKRTTLDITKDDLSCLWAKKDTSSLTGEGLKELFIEVVKLAVKTLDQEEAANVKSSTCNIL